MDNRSVDRVLTPELVSVSVVAEQFPEFGGSQVRSFGAGCDNEVFTVDDKWVFRFLKRGLASEAPSLPLLLHRDLDATAADGADVYFVVAR